MFETEDELIDGMEGGSERAFRLAIDQHHAALLQLANAMVGERIADEVVQEAWVSALRSIAKFERRSSLKTWLLRIVANEAKTRLRKESRLTSLDAMTEDDPELANRLDPGGSLLAGPFEWQGDSPEALISQEELMTCIDRLIASLPEMQAATLHLRERQGYSLPEIANILDITEPNARVLLHRARLRLSKCVEHFQKTGVCRVN